MLVIGAVGLATGEIAKSDEEEVMFDSEKMLDLNEDQLKNMRPLGTKVLVLWETTQETYGKSQLIRPEEYRQAHYTGIVINRGGATREVEVGDRIFFDQFWGGEKFYFGDNRYAIVLESDVMALIPKRDVELMDEKAKQEVLK